MACHQQHKYFYFCLASTFSQLCKYMFIYHFPINVTQQPCRQTHTWPVQGRPVYNDLNYLESVSVSCISKKGNYYFFNVKGHSSCPMVECQWQQKQSCFPKPCVAAGTQGERASTKLPLHVIRSDSDILWADPLTCNGWLNKLIPQRPNIQTMWGKTTLQDIFEMQWLNVGSKMTHNSTWKYSQSYMVHSLRWKS